MHIYDTYNRNLHVVLYKIHLTIYIVVWLRFVNKTERQWWYVTDDQGFSWHTVNLSITAREDFQLVFISRQGRSNLAAALDDVLIIADLCPLPGKSASTLKS